MPTFFLVLALLIPGQAPIVERQEVPTMAVCIEQLTEKLNNLPAIDGVDYIVGASCQMHVKRSDPA